MKSKLKPLVALMFGLTAACKTEGGGSGASEPTAAPAGALGAEETLRLPRDEASQLYLKMLAVELESGFAPPQERLHSVSALVECRKGGAPDERARCELRVRLGGGAAEGALSGTQPLPAVTADRIAAFAAGLRADLAVDRTPLILADVVCDYIGKKSPPFTVEEVTCNAAHPRLPSEAIFDGRLGEELAELARGATVFGADQVTVAGALQCRLVEGSDRAACMVRASSGTALSDTVKPLSQAHSDRASRRLFEAAAERAQIGAGASAQVGVREAAGMMSCAVDSRAVADGGERRVVCRVAL